MTSICLYVNVENLSQSLVKVLARKRGRPSKQICVLPKLSFPINIQLIKLDVRRDGLNHSPKWSEKHIRQKCAPRFTFVAYVKHQVVLCFNIYRN